MIRNIRHKGLLRFFSTSDTKGINAKQAVRIERLLDRLDAASKAEDMLLPGYGFHGLSGFNLKRYAVSVSGNWRISFAFEGEDAVDVDLEGYHYMSLRNPNRKPTPPGAIFREDVLPSLAITQTELVMRLGVSRLTVSELLHEKRGLSADLAIRIGKLTGTSPESWLRMQEACDLWQMSRARADEYAQIEALVTA